VIGNAGVVIGITTSSNLLDLNNTVNSLIVKVVIPIHKRLQKNSAICLY